MLGSFKEGRAQFMHPVYKTCKEDGRRLVPRLSRRWSVLTGGADTSCFDYVGQ
jgi:hypothetical protein